MTDFLYTTYIKTTPDKLWRALTNPEFTRQYWGYNTSPDWKKGSDWVHATPDNSHVNVVGKVLESDPLKKLVLSWASPENKADESQVTFEISVIEDMVRLDVTHSNLSVDMARGVTGGWPRVLASLKSMLETGTALNTWAGKDSPCGSKVA